MSCTGKALLNRRWSVPVNAFTTVRRPTGTLPSNSPLWGRKNRRKELSLPARLLDRGWDAVQRAAELPCPLIASDSVVSHCHLIARGLAFDYEDAPPVDHQVVDLADTGLAVELRLLRINKSQVIEHVDFNRIDERTVEIESHLAFGVRAGDEPWVCRQYFLFVRLDDHGIVWC